MIVRRNAGGAWGGSVSVQSDGTVESLDAEIAANRAGHVQVVWRQRSGMRYAIWTNRFE